MNEFIKHNGLQIVKCIYGVEEQKELIRKYVIGVLPRAKRPDASLPGSLSTVTMRILDTIEKLAPILKDPSFQQEEEWRVIKTLVAKGFDSIDDSLNTLSNRLKRTAEKIDIRPRGDSFIPYLEMPLRYKDEKEEYCVNITQVRISPTNMPDNSKILAEDACRILLYNSANTANGNAEVVSSKIPYIGL